MLSVSIGRANNLLRWASELGLWVILHLVFRPMLVEHFRPTNKARLLYVCFSVLPTGLRFLLFVRQSQFFAPLPPSNFRFEASGTRPSEAFSNFSGARSAGESELEDVLVPGAPQETPGHEKGAAESALRIAWRVALGARCAAGLAGFELGSEKGPEILQSTIHNRDPGL